MIDVDWQGVAPEPDPLRDAVLPAGAPGAWIRDALDRPPTLAELVDAIDRARADHVAARADHAYHRDELAAARRRLVVAARALGAALDRYDAERVHADPTPTREVPR